MNTINIVSKRADGTTVTKKLTHVNPEAKDIEVAKFAASLAKLSGNTLTALERTEAESLIIPGVNIQAEQKFNGTSKDDYILNVAKNATITSGTGNDSIENTGNNVSIDAGADNDSIHSKGENVTITAGDGDDSVHSEGNNNTITSGTGNDSIENTGNNVSINAGADNDSIHSKGEGVTINAGDGNDSVHSEGNNNTITAGIGNTTIFNAGNDVSIKSGDGNDSIKNTGNNVTIRTAKGNNFVENSGQKNLYVFYGTGGENTITGFSQNDTLLWSGALTEYVTQVATGYEVKAENTKVLLEGINFEPTVLDAPKEIFIATSAAETITVQKDQATAFRAGKQVTLKSSNEDAVYGGVDADSGKDKITVQSDTEKLSIMGGRGDDSIFIDSQSGYKGNYYVYNSGDGKDSISGWTDSDTLVLDTNDYQISMSADGNHFYVKVGTGYVDFVDLVNGVSKVNVSVIGGASETYIVPRFMEGTTASNTIYNLSTRAVYHGGADSQTAWTIDAKGGNDKIYNDQNYVSIFGSTGNDLVSIKAADESSTTTGVTIKGGAGTDTIDVENDFYTTDTGAGTVTIHGAHVYEFSPGDGSDTIQGYNGNDTIVLEEMPETYTFTGNVDMSGNYVIKAQNITITLKKPADRLLCGERITILNKAGDGKLTEITNKLEGDGVTAVPTIIGGVAKTIYEIPMKILLTTGANSATYSSPDHDYYSIDASSGNDTLLIDGARGMSIRGGSGNDRITLQGGTNLTDTAAVASAAYISGATVTVRGGTDNDYIVATFDSNTVLIGGTATAVLATHVYEIGTGDGKDTIVGFNENDTIRIHDGTGADSISATFDATGKYLLLKVGNTSTYIGLNENFRGGKEIHIVDSDNGVIELSTDTGFSRVYYADSDCKVETETTTANVKYFVPRILKGTNAADGVVDGKIFLTNEEDNFTINALNGSDVIENKGASNVYIDGGSGDDVIYLSSRLENINGSDTAIYGENVSVYGGIGNDTIFGEMIEYDVGKGKISHQKHGTDNVADYVFDEGREFGHVYMFNYLDVSDVIYFMSEKDTIALDDSTTLVGVLVNEENNDVVLYLGSVNNPTKIIGNITLKEYAAGVESFMFRYWDNAAGKYVTEKRGLPKDKIGTTGSDYLENTREEYSIYGYAGNDTIRNSGAGSSIYAGAGYDRVYNEADNVYIDAGTGDDRVVIVNGKNNTIKAGQGDDTIFAGSGGKQTYIFGKNHGTNYVYGFGAEDTLKFDEGVRASDVSSETDVGSVIFTVGDTKVILGGELKENEGFGSETTVEDWVAYQVDTDNYLAFSVGKINVEFSD